MQRIPLRKRYSALAMALQTALGIRRMGVFTPLKYADRIPARPPEYSAWARALERAAPAFAEVLETIAARRDEIESAVRGPLAGLQGSFNLLDTAAAYAMLCRAGPRRIIEVGSGASTHVMAAAAPQARITCIDPVPRAEISALGVEWIRGVLEGSNLAPFEALAPGDVAFFDSSHVLHQGTDVDIILNRVLPVLAPGVIVHFHDIFHPDPYPTHWRLRAYNEQCALSGWVLSGAMAPLFSAHYAATRMTDATRRALGPLAGAEIGGGSLWLRR